MSLGLFTLALSCLNGLGALFVGSGLGGTHTSLGSLGSLGGLLSLLGLHHFSGFLFLGVLSRFNSGLDFSEHQGNSLVILFNSSDGVGLSLSGVKDADTVGGLSENGCGNKR